MQPLEHRPALFRQRLPRRHVRMVIEFSDDDLIAGLERPADRAGHVKQNRGHVRAERDLTRRGAEEIGQRYARGGQQGIGLDAVG